MTLKTFEFTIRMTVNASTSGIARDKIYQRIKKYQGVDVLEVKEVEFRG